MGTVVRPHPKRALLPALIAIVLLAAATHGAAAASAPATAAGVAGAVVAGQEGGDAVDGDLQAVIDAELDAATGNPAYARLRALVNSGRIPPAARASIVRVLDEGVQRAAPAAHACRRLANADAVRDQSELATRCRAWIESHDDGPLALAACRRVAQSEARPASLTTLVSRCRAVLAEYGPDDNALRGICARIAASDAAADADDALVQRCRALRASLDTDGAARLAVCIRIARFAADQPALLERCRALLTDRGGDNNNTRSLRAETRTATRANVGAETEGRSIQTTGTARFDVRARRAQLAPAGVATSLAAGLQLAASTATGSAD